MTIYTAKFRTDLYYAERTFEADTPEQALAVARAFHNEHDQDLMYDEYAGSSPVNEIEIDGPDGRELAIWYDDDQRLRLAARDLLDALEAQTAEAQAVIDTWAKGDLAAAVRMLDASIPVARAAIARAKPPSG
jgi:hypothetical protein